MCKERIWRAIYSSITQETNNLLHPSKPMLLIEGGVGIFGFGHFLGRFFGFSTKKRRFFGFCDSYGFGFSLFSVFRQNTTGFSGLVSNAVFGFACLVSGFWFPQSRERTAGVLK